MTSALPVSIWSYGRQYCLVVNSSATLAVSPLNLTGCLEKSKTAEAMTLPSSSLMLTLTSDSLNSAVSPSFVDAQLEVSCSCATRLASLWSTEPSSASGAAVQGLSSFAALLSPDLVLPLCWDVDCV